MLETKPIAIRSQINQEIGKSMHRNELMKTPTIIKHLLFYPLSSSWVFLVNHLIRYENNILKRTRSLFNLSSQKHANCGNCLQKKFVNWIVRFPISILLSSYCFYIYHSYKLGTKIVISIYINTNFWQLLDTTLLFNPKASSRCWVWG